jgi:hypothetical protein
MKCNRRRSSRERAGIFETTNGHKQATEAHYSK